MLLNISKGLVVAALGLFATACTLAMVDLTDNGAKEYGYTVDQHVTAPWRMVPPVQAGNEQRVHDDGFCVDTPEGEVCTANVTSTYTFVDRYSAASKRGTWPLAVGL